MIGADGGDDLERRYLVEGVVATYLPPHARCFGKNLDQSLLDQTMETLLVSLTHLGNRFGTRDAWRDHLVQRCFIYRQLWWAHDDDVRMVVVLSRVVAAPMAGTMKIVWIFILKIVWRFARSDGFCSVCMRCSLRVQ